MKRLIALSAVALTSFSAAASELVVYSARNEQLIKPIFERYTEASGVRVRYITDKEGPLMARLQAEGAATPADVFLTVDAGNLWQAAEAGLLRTLASPRLAGNIPSHLRDPQDRWVGLSVRARTIVYHADRVQPATLSSYEALADADWKDRLCLRTSKKVYNQSLVAMMISALGEARAEAIVRGWVANLAAAPYASDNEVMEAIAAGRCDVGLVNTYYYGRLLREKPELPLRLYWPNQAAAQGRLGGVHINVSGAGIAKHSKRPEQARAFLEWLSAADGGQALFAALNLEYPANPRATADEAVAEWGEFKQDLINVAEAGRLQANAVRLMDRAGYR